MDTTGFRSNKARVRDFYVCFRLYGRPDENQAACNAFGIGSGMDAMMDAMTEGTNQMMSAMSGTDQLFRTITVVNTFFPYRAMVVRSVLSPELSDFRFKLTQFLNISGELLCAIPLGVEAAEASVDVAVVDSAVRQGEPFERKIRVSLPGKQLAHGALSDSVRCHLVNKMSLDPTSFVVTNVAVQ